MRKLIALFLCTIALASCQRVKYDSLYEITYKVYYPGETVTKSFTFHAVEGEAKYQSYVNFSENRLIVQAFHTNNPFRKNLIILERTTAPIQVTGFKLKSNIEKE